MDHDKPSATVPLTTGLRENDGQAESLPPGEADNDPMMTPSASDYPNNSIVVAVLIALVCILFLIC